MEKRRNFFENLSRFFSFQFCFSGLPINFWYYYLTFWTLKYKFRAEIFFDDFFDFFGNFQDFWDNSFLENSLRTPRNLFLIPRSPRNVNLLLRDSSIPRGMKFSEELPSLVKMDLNIMVKSGLEIFLNPFIQKIIFHTS